MTASRHGEKPLASGRVRSACFETCNLSRADFAGAKLLGADFSRLRYAAKASWRGAYYDDFTRLDPAIDKSVMIYVPEPTGNLLLSAGVAGTPAERRPRALARPQTKSAPGRGPGRFVLATRQ